MGTPPPAVTGGMGSPHVGGWVVKGRQILNAKRRKFFNPLNNGVFNHFPALKGQAKCRKGKKVPLEPPDPRTPGGSMQEGEEGGDHACGHGGGAGKTPISTGPFALCSQACLALTAKLNVSSRPEAEAFG